jgi:hypothetical protein
MPLSRDWTRLAWRNLQSRRQHVGSRSGSFGESRKLQVLEARTRVGWVRYGTRTCGKRTSCGTVAHHPTVTGCVLPDAFGPGRLAVSMDTSFNGC